MENAKIHNTAIVSEKAQIGKNAEIGPFSIIEDDVIIGDNVKIKNNVLISNGARIGNDCEFHTGAIVSTDPQDLKYAGEDTYTHIGDETVVREYASINKGTVETGNTKIGKNCLIMAYCHVAHDCYISDNVIISNMTQLAGHVIIDEWVVLGGVVKVHQFSKIGKHSMIGADTKIVKDVPPFTLVGRQPPQVEGVNKIGLRRRGFDKNIIKNLEVFYDTVLFSGYNNKDGMEEYLKFNPEPCTEVNTCISFIKESTRGIYR